MRRLWLLAFLLIFPRIVSAAPTDAATYRAQLQSADAALQQMQTSQAQRPAAKVQTLFKSLSNAQNIKRADGKTQTSGGDEWTRRARDIDRDFASSEQIAGAREVIKMRLQSLDNWTRGGDGASEAQTIFKQLETTGQIRTGPTQLEQWIADIKRAVVGGFLNFLKWLAGLLPKPSSQKSLPNVQINPLYVKVFFGLSLLALLGILGWLMWRAFGDRLGRAKPAREVRFLGEDAELLELPPDELSERARRFAKDGNFREALRHLYLSLLLQLEARGVWRYDARRTNWEHIRALQKSSERNFLIAPLADLTRRFDRVRYGGAACSETDWAHFERDVQTLENSALKTQSSVLSTQHSKGAVR